MVLGTLIPPKAAPAPNPGIDYVLTQTNGISRMGPGEWGAPEIDPALSRSEVDVMVLYTGLAKSAYGEAGIRDKIALSIAYMNEACHRSGVNARFRLVYQGETTWHTESPLSVNELYWLASDSTVAELRAGVGADLVSLLVRDGLPTGGMAQLPGSCSIFNGSPFIFTHEAGHNLGCAHDRLHADSGYDKSGCNYGYSFTPPNGSDVYGDIMSYVGSQIQQFSSPERFFLGEATGLPEGHVNRFGEPDAADNVLALNRRVPYTALSLAPQVVGMEALGLSADGGEFRFRIAGPGLDRTSVEFTSDWNSWSVLTECDVTPEGTEIVDGNVRNSWRFYRPAVQEGRTSVQIGYVIKTIPAGYSMIANPLEAKNNTVASLLPAVPDGMLVYKWIEGRQAWTCNSYSFGEWDDPTMTLPPGEGAIVKNPTGAPFTVHFVGEVNQACYNRVPIQHSIRSATMPQAGGLSSVLKYQPFDSGGKVFRMTHADGRYTVYQWEDGHWLPEEPQIEIGEAFWCQNPINAFNWQALLPAGQK